MIRFRIVYYNIDFVQLNMEDVVLTKRRACHDSGEFSLPDTWSAVMMTSTNRSKAYLARLARGGGAPVRVDTSGEDLCLLDELVSSGYAPSRVEAYRRAMREAHQKWIEEDCHDH